ncbi:YcaO-like family protein [Psychromonas aquimarina]|uniref:YcaO-like family protein n=1 Tax=Psychromonas aquimarina TaxID=444919 RepID=UPI0004188554|nr:YcaO-like family protein [Psychromonas aquimarina]
MKEILSWHPKFNVYCLDNLDILLISESDSFSLPHVNFALFSMFDGVKSVDEILAEAQLAMHKTADFLYQVDNFKKQQLLVDKNYAESAAYINYYTNSSTLIAQEENYSLLNLCGLSVESIDQWLSVTAQLHLSESLSSSVCFMLTDSFLNPEIINQLPADGDLCLIKVCGEKIWVGPLLSAADAPEYVTALQSRLQHNNPTLALAESLFPEQSLCIPYCEQDRLSVPQLQCIVHELNKQLSEQLERVVIIPLSTQQVQYHPVCLADNHQQAFSKQVNSAVKLQNCPVNFNIDGGSRAVDPQQTVQSIKPFISPITGLITHIQVLKECKNDPVKIYSTAFFKTPALKDSWKLDHSSFVHSCMGKGVSHIQSQASALCEAIERYSSHYQGDEPLHLSVKSKLDKRYYDFQQLVPYSQKQYQNFTDPSHSDSLLKQAAMPYQDQAVHWLPAWSLSEQQQVYLPLTHCLANIPFEDDQFARWHSNGCAAGNTLEEAVLQALFELIERDAAAIWWYNRTPRPEFNMDLIDPEHFSLLDATLSKEHDFWVLDLTHDIEVPVMVAVGRNKQTQGLSFGFGCHLQSELAAQRALTELCQLIPIRDQNGAPFDFNAVVEQPFLFPGDFPAAQSTDFTTSGDIKTDIENIVKKLKELNLETLVFNYSRDPLPIKAAKVFVPGLCHIWPQLANSRLYQAPVDLGWLESANTEETINQHALYI